MSIHDQYPTEAQGRLPSFNSYEEEAEFWDTHDYADLSELRPEDFPDDPKFAEHLRLKFGTPGSESR
ncbi:MAG: hypothetical protein H0V24_04700 [Chloroflexia bacterium]|nr:hypothetical protein [Chloroflexia bacterium]